MFSGLRFKPLFFFLVFSLILAVASRLLYPYSTNDKTSRFNGEKILHSEGHLESFAELHGEERREEGDKGDQEEKRGNQKGREQSSHNQIPICSPQPGIRREVHEVTYKRRRRKEIEVTRRRRGWVKRRETDLASIQFPKCSPQPRIPKVIQSWVEKRRGREEIEVT